MVLTSAVYGNVSANNAPLIKYGTYANKDGSLTQAQNPDNFKWAETNSMWQAQNNSSQAWKNVTIQFEDSNSGISGTGNSGDTTYTVKAGGKKDAPSAFIEVKTQDTKGLQIGDGTGTLTIDLGPVSGPTNNDAKRGVKLDLSSANSTAFKGNLAITGGRDQSGGSIASFEGKFGGEFIGNITISRSTTGYSKADSTFTFTGEHAKLTGNLTSTVGKATLNFNGTSANSITGNIKTDGSKNTSQTITMGSSTDTQSKTSITNSITGISPPIMALLLIYIS